MVVVYIAAGLANKMFQYAFSRGLMSHGLDVFLDQTSFQPEWSFEDIALEEVFPNIEIKNAPNNMFSLAYKKDLLSRIYRRMSAFFPNNRYLMERPFIYDELIYKKATSNCIFCGLWQTELYFNFCEKDVRRNFVFTPFQDDQNIQLAEKMKNENSIIGFLYMSISTCFILEKYTYKYHTTADKTRLIPTTYNFSPPYNPSHIDIGNISC